MQYFVLPVLVDLNKVHLRLNNNKIMAIHTPDAGKSQALLAHNAIDRDPISNILQTFY